MPKSVKKQAPGKAKPRAAKPRARKTGGKRHLLPWLLACNLLLLFFLTLAGAAYFVFLHPWGAEPPAPASESRQPDRPVTIAAERKKKVVAHAARRPADAPADAPADNLADGLVDNPVDGRPHQPPAPAAGREPAAVQARPRVAILIDDMGHDLAIGRAFLRLETNLSFAFLPLAPHSRQLAGEAELLGRDILLHLPLEPEDPEEDPGPGALSVAMDRPTMRATFLDDLKRLPLARGVNNHMGSKFTASRPDMEYLLELIGQKDLFFVDSVTTPASVGFELARARGMPAARRHIFLDHQPDRKTIIAQLEQLIDLARHQGEAVAIGHPRSATLEALRHLAPRLATEVTVVNIHELTK